MTEQNDHKPNAETLSVAADWHARLTGDEVSEESWVEFAAWSEADPAHSEAYRLVVEAETLAEDLISDKQHFTIDTRQEIAQPKSKRPYYFGALMAIAATLVVVLMPASELPPTLPPTIYESALGNIEQIALADGSELTLNGGSRLAVTLSDVSRNVTLIDGQALFNVEKDASRPFNVQAAGERVTVVGTRFTVERVRASIEVVVEEGIVEVTPSTGGAPIRLTVNQMWRYDGVSKTHGVSSIDASSNLAWTYGELNYENSSFSEIAKDLERLLGKRFILGAGVSTLKFSGTLQTENIEDLKLLLTRTLPIKWEDRNGTIHITFQE